MKLNIQLECNCTKENVTDIFNILDEEVQPFSLAISKMHGNKCSCEYTRNCVNGLFCTKLKIYVEYKNKKVCTLLNNSK